MTPCYICGTPIDEIQINAFDLKPEPCGGCLSVISDALDGYEEPDVDEPILEEEGEL